MLNAFVRPSRDLRNNYAELAKIVKQHDHVIITNNGRGESVLIGIEDYAKYEEFLHHRYVQEKLSEAKKQSLEKDVSWTDHDVAWEQLREKYEI